MRVRIVSETIPPQSGAAMRLATSEPRLDALEELVLPRPFQEAELPVFPNDRDETSA